MSMDLLPETVIIPWAEKLGCSPDAWSIIVVLVNKAKNYDTATAMMFELGWVEHRDWLRRASDTLRTTLSSPEYQGHVADAQWLYEFSQYYIKEVESDPRGTGQ